MRKYPYRRLKAIWCRLIGHDWMAYDFYYNFKTKETTHVDKCLFCNRERLERVQRDDC
jgi:hypothetical protein